MKDIYQEQKMSTEDTVLITFDTAQNLTLGQMISQFIDHSADTNITLYLINGQQFNIKEFNSFIKYLSTKFTNINVYIRGYFHLEMLSTFIYPTYISSDSRVVYDASKLHIMLQNCPSTTVRDKLIAQYINKYNHYELGYLPITELTSLGLSYELF
jgi:hypothetical protein